MSKKVYAFVDKLTGKIETHSKLSNITRFGTRFLYKIERMSKEQLESYGIHEVTLEDPVFDEDTQKVTGPVFSLTDGKITGEYIIEQLTESEISKNLTDIKNEAIKKAKEKRQKECKSVNIVLDNGEEIEFPCDSETITFLTATCLAFSSVEKSEKVSEINNINWKVGDTFLSLSEKEVKDIAEKAFFKIESSFNELKQNIKKIKSCTLVSEVKSIIANLGE